MATPKSYSTGVDVLTTLDGTERVLVDNGGATLVVVTSQTIGNLAGAIAGTFVANQATAVVVPNVNITATSVVLFGLKTIGGTPAGAPFISAVTPGVGFSVKSVAGDTSTYNYKILN